MARISKKVKKRTIIEIPLNDYNKISKYAKKYNLSFSSAIQLLALKTLEYEQMINLAPAMIKIINEELKLEEK